MHWCFVPLCVFFFCKKIGCSEREFFSLDKQHRIYENAKHVEQAGDTRLARGRKLQEGSIRHLFKRAYPDRCSPIPDHWLCGARRSPGAAARRGAIRQIHRLYRLGRPRGYTRRLSVTIARTVSAAGRAPGAIPAPAPHWPRAAQRPATHTVQTAGVIRWQRLTLLVNDDVRRQCKSKVHLYKQFTDSD